MGESPQPNMDKEVEAVLDYLDNLCEEAKWNDSMKTGYSRSEILMHGINNLLEEYDR